MWPNKYLSEISVGEEEFIERTEVSRVGIMHNYKITFKDIDGDGNIEIIQTEVEKEVEWSLAENDYIPIEKGLVENIFEWDEKEKLFKLVSWKLEI